MKRALISVYDKSGIVDFARGLQQQGIEIISTGGTARQLQDHGITVHQITDLTGFPEILDGRVKTLHPRVHGAILAKRSNAEHMQVLEQHQIQTIDMVVCNLYPFEATIARPQVSLEEALENIDIGGPTMVRAAAKNFSDVVVVVDPADYDQVLYELSSTGTVGLNTRKKLAAKAFRHTAVYDAVISSYLSEEKLSGELALGLRKAQELRYGENPHQSAAVYRTLESGASILAAKQLQGKALSYNNINDADAALRMVLEFSRPAAVAVKHTNPCGAAEADDIVTAYQRAHDADPVSIFGGIVAVNRPITAALAEEMNKIFLDIILAPEVTPEARAILAKKKNLRVLEVPGFEQGYGNALEIRSVLGGALVQERDMLRIEQEEWQTVTSHTVSAEQLDDLRFAWKVVKHVKSNAIVVVKDSCTLGIGCGQVNRVDAARYALARGGDACHGAVLASDGLLPFPDVVEEAARAGISAIVQPGGSIRDRLSIEAAEKYGIAMLFTGVRHFKH